MGPGRLGAAGIKRLPGLWLEKLFLLGGLNPGVINWGLTSDVPFSVEDGDFARCPMVRSRFAVIKPGNVSAFSEKKGSKKRHFSRLQRLQRTSSA